MVMDLSASLRDVTHKEESRSPVLTALLLSTEVNSGLLYLDDEYIQFVINFLQNIFLTLQNTWE